MWSQQGILWEGQSERKGIAKNQSGKGLRISEIFSVSRFGPSPHVNVWGGIELGVAGKHAAAAPVFFRTVKPVGGEDGASLFLETRAPLA